MAISKESMEKMQARQQYRNHWHINLLSAPPTDCRFCCISALCPPCISFKLRKRALYGDMTKYVCCAGYFPCSGKCGEQKCPTFCLVTEVCLCFGNSVASTRFLLQDELNIQTTKCDNCIIAFMMILQMVSCIFHIVACIVGSSEVNHAAHALSILAEAVYCTVCACMQTQHKIEMDKREGILVLPNVMEVPPQQQMSRQDGQVPPPVGYPAVGYPAQGYTK